MTNNALSNQTVAVIGAGGFLGAHVVRRLQNDVADLRCFGHSRQYPEVLAGLRWISGDMADASVDEAIHGCDCVIHLASASVPAAADRDIPLDAEDNVVGSLRLIERCVAAGVKRFVFLSSGGTVYGIPTLVPTPESAPTTPITAYGVAKLAIEKYLEIYRRQKGLDYRILRVSNLYGPYQSARRGQGAVAAFLGCAMTGRPIEIWGDGSVVRDYVYAEDVAQAVAAAISHRGEDRIFNIGSGSGLSLLDIIDSIERLIDHPLERTLRPARSVDVPVSILDCTLAARSLHWRATTDFDSGLKAASAWLVSQ